MILSGKTDGEIWSKFIELVDGEIKAAEQLAAETHSSYAGGIVYGLKHLRIHLQQRRLAAAHISRRPAAPKRPRRPER